MEKRPLSVTAISCLFIATGILGLVAHASEFQPQHPFSSDVVWAALARLSAIVAGVFMLRGCDWARWLALAWIAFHVILSIFHSWLEVAIHSLLFAAIAYILLRRAAREYFRRAAAQTRGI